MTLPGFVTCPTCGGSGKIKHLVEVVVPGHALNCGGETCERTCPVPYRQQDVEVEPCLDCVAGQVPSPETVEWVAEGIINRARVRSGFINEDVQEGEK